MANQRAAGKVQIGLWVDEKLAYFIDEKYGKGNRSALLLRAIFEKMKGDEIDVSGFDGEPPPPIRHRREYSDAIKNDPRIKKLLSSSAPPEDQSLVKRVREELSLPSKRRSKKPTVSTSGEKP